VIGKGRSRRPVAGSPPFYRVDLSSYSSWRVVGERRRTVYSRRLSLPSTSHFDLAGRC